MLKTFLKHGKLSVYFEPINKKLYKNICYLNKTIIDVNTKCCDMFSKNKRYKTVDFKYDGKKGNLQSVSRHANSCNDKHQGQKEVNNEWFDEKEFAESFIPSFCVTVYKYQGTDINEHYNIFHINRMDKKQLYTALSRTTKLEYIHLNNKEVNRRYINRKQPTLETVNSKFNNLFKNGQIYKITFDNNMIYIGSTCEDLKTRIKKHLLDNKSRVYKYKNESLENRIDCKCSK